MNATHEDYVDVTDELAAKAELEAEISKLAEAVAEDAPPTSVVKAVEKLVDLKLGRVAQQLLNSATENVATNRAIGLEGSAKDEALNRATLFKVCDGDLTRVIEAIIGCTGESERGGVVYSAVYAVQKAACFVANNVYRRELDRRDDDMEARGEVALPMNVDPREDHREPPYGLGPEPSDLELEGGGATHETALDGFTELHTYLQLLTEAFGWDPDRPMPYLVTQSKDGHFVQITDAEAALDLMEVRRNESRARAQDRRSKSLKQASQLAMKFIKSAVAKREVA